MSIKITAAAISNIGCLRKNNEDNFYIQGKIRRNPEQPNGQALYRGRDTRTLFAVADGMGGEEYGEIAAQITVQHLRGCAFEDITGTAEACIRAANEAICREMIARGKKRMGSTLAALYIDNGQAVSCNVGDSRVYLCRENRLQQLSVDHNRAQMMIRMGMLTPEQARTHRDRHVLTQNLGIFEEELLIEPAFSEPVALNPGDIFLLCSDGLTDMVTDEEIAAQLSSGTAMQQAKRLTDLALAHGGRDNVTVAVVQIRRSLFSLFGR